jgi:hypothetical protein
MADSDLLGLLDKEIGNCEWPGRTGGSSYSGFLYSTIQHTSVEENREYFGEGPDFDGGSRPQALLTA